MDDQAKKARTWAITCHLIPLIGFIGIPLGHLLGPFLIWLFLKKDFPGLVVSKLDYPGEKAEKIIKELGLKYLDMKTIGLILMRISI